jgi:hypothetical protein
MAMAFTGDTIRAMVKTGRQPEEKGDRAVQKTVKP